MTGHTQFRVEEDGTFLFSQTAVNKFRLCPELARATWTGEHVERFGAEAMVGIAAHAGIDAWSRGEDWERALALAIADEWDSVMFPPGADTLSQWDVIQIARHAVPVGGRIAEARQNDRMHSELSLVYDLPYGRHKKKLRGTLDEVQWGEPGGYSFFILDWKVSRSIKYRVGQKIAELRKEAVQPTVYVYLLSRMMQVEMSDILFTFIAIDPATGSTYEVPVERNENDVKRLAVELDAICDLWQSHHPQWPVAPAGHWMCRERWCSHWSACVINQPQPITLSSKGQN